MKVGQRVFVRNTEKASWEVGVILSSYRREKVVRYDVLLERGIRMDFLCTNHRNSFYIDSEKSTKFFAQLNPDEVRGPDSESQA